MKKHLIAAAVAGALAVPAMAQVSISGRIDTSIQSFDSGAASAGSSTRINGGLLTSNQIVLSGAEDLGGGLRAGFNIASGFNSDRNGSFDLGSRGIVATLSGGFGAVELGKTNGTTLNSLTGSALTGNLGNLLAAEGRPDNMVGYTSPSISGLSLRVIYSTGNETPGATKGDGSQTEISASYRSGPISVRLAQASFKKGSLSAVSGGGVTGVVALAAVATQDFKQTGADLNANFGSLGVNARYTQIKLDVAAQNLLRGTTQFGIGASYPISSGLTAAIDYMDVDNEAASADWTRISATLVNSLSKRTNIYGAYYTDNFEQSGRSNASVMAVGVRHSF